MAYDLACQYKPLANAVDTDPALVPVYANPHVDHDPDEGKFCIFDLGVGRTDGEGVERAWAMLNPIQPNCKQMKW